MEFGTVYRYEQTGELNGMLRVRGLTQDDAHIFCTADQVEEEFRNTINLTRFVLESVGLKDYRVQLSLRDPKSDKYVGSEENWQKAEAALRRVLEESGLNFQAAEGEAAFYGPKADFMVRAIASVASGNWVPCSWTITCQNVSNWNTSAPTIRLTALS